MSVLFYCHISVIFWQLTVSELTLNNIHVTACSLLDLFVNNFGVEYLEHIISFIKMLTECSENTTAKYSVLHYFHSTCLSLMCFSVRLITFSCSE